MFVFVVLVGRFKIYFVSNQSYNSCPLLIFFPLISMLFSHFHVFRYRSHKQIVGTSCISTLLTLGPGSPSLPIGPGGPCATTQRGQSTSLNAYSISDAYHRSHWSHGSGWSLCELWTWVDRLEKKRQTKYSQDRQAIQSVHWSQCCPEGPEDLVVPTSTIV